RRVAADCDGQPPRRDRAPLTSRPDLDVLKRWLRHWTKVRHREAAERTLLTVIAAGASPAALADLLVSAAADRVYADGGHLLDFINKACECLDLIGWEHSAAVLPSVVGQLVAAQGAEEATAWRHPIDLVSLCEEATQELQGLSAGMDSGKPWSEHAALAEALLGDEPNAILEALKAAVRAGASPVDLSRSLTYAAALRVAQFGTANEHSDWETAHHVFTYSNAVHQALKRIAAGGTLPNDAAEATRSVLHGAMAVYLSRYLNVPPARLPDESDPRLNGLPQSSQEIRAALLDALDRQRQVDAVGSLVARHFALGHPPDELVTTLAHALLREDAGFHACQMLEAGIRQFGTWADTRQGGHILIGVGRYLAAHSPSERAAFQTADIARRLLHGSELHQMP
ncbi:Rieske (2Fe-2S) protein, partial [Microvirga aerophila]|uniref:Rieske (2Fe-2S) protein n=1 Tax=Microvirga aerophila TaxID=670291 RepID=UPI001478C7FB